MAVDEPPSSSVLSASAASAAADRKNWKVTNKQDHRKYKVGRRNHPKERDL